MCNGRPVAGFGTQALYGLGAASSGIKMRALSSFLLLFYNQALGLSPTSVSFVITIILVFDAVCDPLVGHTSDRFRSRWGRRHPFMYASALPLSVAFFLLWNPPGEWSEHETLLWLFACLLVIRAADTLFELPSVALAPELVEDYDGRTRIVNLRIFFRTIAGLFVTVVGLQIFLRPGPDGSGGATSPDGYFGFSLTLAIAMFVVIIVSSAATHRFIPYLRQPEAAAARKQSFWRDARGLLRNRSALVMLGVGMLQSIAGGAKAGLDLYFGLYFWAFTQAQLSMMAFLTAAGALVGAFGVGAVGRRLGKRTGTIVCYALGLINGTLPVVLRLLDLMPANGTQALFLLMAAEAFLLGALYVMSAVLMNSMLADVVEDVAVETGQRSEGLLFSADQFFTKAVSGIGVMVSGGLLAIIAFPRDAKPGAVEPEMIHRLGLLYVPAVVGLTALAIALLFFYRIDRERHHGNLARLRATEGADLFEAVVPAAR
jgi:Na+/melibiose symporter-like transporter